METEYNQLKDAYKVKSRNSSLFDYMVRNNIFYPHNLFHEHSKEQLIEDYKRITEEHLKILENL